jgi:CheY-like chemotaxis protein
MRCDAFTGGQWQRILVVEDNDLNRKLFCDLLVANGFTVEPVADGREAISARASSCRGW